MGTEPKPFASLSSGLLARKGAARPAMRPQGFGQGGSSLDDLGWNDMGFEPPKPALTTHEVVEHPRAHATGLTPVQSPVHDQQAEIEERFNSADDDEVEDVYSAVDDLEVEEDETDVDDRYGSLTGPREEEPEESLAEESELEDEEFDETAEPYEPEPIELAHPVTAVVAPVIEGAPVVETPAAAPSPVVVETPVSIPQGFVPQAVAPQPRAAPGTKAKAAFTLRLDPNRHLKLRLACAVDGRSAQQLVTDALDQLLERMPELDGLAAKAKRRG